MKRAFPIFAVLTAVLLSYALYEALVAAPTEQTMGNVQRIFYYHVPSAWTAFLLFFINFVCSIQYLVRRDKVADTIANWVAIVLGIAALGFWHAILALILALAAALGVTRIARRQIGGQTGDVAGAAQQLDVRDRVGTTPADRDHVVEVQLLGGAALAAPAAVPRGHRDLMDIGQR